MPSAGACALRLVAVFATPMTGFCTVKLNGCTPVSTTEPQDTVPVVCAVNCGLATLAVALLVLKVNRISTSDGWLALACDNGHSCARGGMCVLFQRNWLVAALTTVGALATGIQVAPLLMLYSPLPTRAMPWAVGLSVSSKAMLKTLVGPVLRRRMVVCPVPHSTQVVAAESCCTISCPRGKIKVGLAGLMV